MRIEREELILPLSLSRIKKRGRENEAPLVRAVNFSSVLVRRT